MPVGHEHVGVLLKTAESLIVAACFGIIAGVLIILLGDIPGLGRPFRVIERFGTDAGMSLHTWFTADRLCSVHAGHHPADCATSEREPAYVFLDIGHRACVDFFSARKQGAPANPELAGQRCRIYSPDQPELVAEVLETVLAPGVRPRAVVLDTLLINPEVSPEWPPSGKTIDNAGLVPIVAVLPSRWTGYRGTVWVDRSKDPVASGLLPGETTVTAIAFFGADPWDDGDPLIRRNWPAVLSDEDGNNR